MSLDMLIPLLRRSRLYVPLLAIFLVVSLYRHFGLPRWRRVVTTKDGGGGERQEDTGISLDDEGYGRARELDAIQHGHSNVVFTAGTAKPPGSNYTRTIVMPRTTEEDVSWLKEAFPPASHPDLRTAIYTVDSPTADLPLPKNKGREVMVYLTYIIAHYDTLSDITLFLHSHRRAYHINDLLSNDAVEVISRLSSARVAREGYMNLRCQWRPGCPAWLHPADQTRDINKLEQAEMARAWAQLFPDAELPETIAQACCAQFALSRQRIRSLPRARYVAYRDWLLATPLSDAISGRIWEYLWAFVFTGRDVVCPAEHVCYCDGFGLCFGGRDAYDYWWRTWYEKGHLEDALKRWTHTRDRLEALRGPDGMVLETAELQIPESGRDRVLSGQIEELSVWLKEEREKAIERGMHPRARAAEAGREWRDGDGF